MLFKIFYYYYFPHTNAYGRSFDFAVELSKVHIGSSFEQIRKTLSPQCYIEKLSLKASLDLEKKSFKGFF